MWGCRFVPTVCLLMVVSAIRQTTNVEGECSWDESDSTDIVGDLVETKYDIATSDECCSSCDQNSDCDGFVYEAAFRVCYLKGNFMRTMVKGGVVSRFKSTLGAGHPGFQSAEHSMDLAGTLLEQWAAPNSEVCSVACNKNSICEGFVFYDFQCYLKTDVKGSYIHEGRVSFRKLWPATCPSENVLWDIDFNGTILTTYYVDTRHECCVLCDENFGCQGVTYSADTKACHHKANFQGTFPSTGVTTQLRLKHCDWFQPEQEGKDLSGTLMEQWAAHNQESCCAACSRKDECDGFAFVNKVCYLKSEVLGFYDNDGVVARVKLDQP